MTEGIAERLHFLLIDDNAADRRLIGQQLKQTFSRLQITEIVRMETWSRVLERNDIDLIITDYRLPWTDGLAILQTSKNRWPACPVIMFPAGGDEEIAVAAMKAGVDDYIPKSPDRLDRLATTAQELLEKGRPPPPPTASERPDLTEHKRELILLNRAIQAFTSTLEVDEVLNSVLEEVKRSLKVVACSVWLVDPETKDLVCRQVTDPHSEVVRGWRLPPGQGLGGWVVQHGRSLNTPDVLKNKRHFKGVDQQTGLLLRSILTIPLRTKQGVIGVLQLVDKTVNRFDGTDQRLGEALAVVAASAIENAQLYEQAQQAAETKAILLDEINHRVKNNLTAIIGLLYAERRQEGMENQITYQKIIDTLINRVQGLVTVHHLLSVSGWSPLPLSELAAQIIHSALHARLPTKNVLVDVRPSAVRVRPKQAHSLALVINELTTNTVKYAVSEQNVVRIEVKIRQDEVTAAPARLVTVEYRDDGPGYPETVLRGAGHDVGLHLIQSITRADLRGEITFTNDNGAVSMICFKLMEEKVEI